jgi:hypothetical protein
MRPEKTLNAVNELISQGRFAEVPQFLEIQIAQIKASQDKEPFLDVVEKDADTLWHRYEQFEPAACCHEIIFKLSKEIYGENNLKTWKSLRRISSFHSGPTSKVPDDIARASVAKAVVYYEMLLDLLTRYDPNNKTEIARVWSCLIYSADWGNDDLSQPEYERVLELRTRGIEAIRIALGERSREIANEYFRLAAFQRRNGRIYEAENLDRQLMEIEASLERLSHESRI